MWVRTEVRVLPSELTALVRCRILAAVSHPERATMCGSRYRNLPTLKGCIQTAAAIVVAASSCDMAGSHEGPLLVWAMPLHG